MVWLKKRKGLNVEGVGCFPTGQLAPHWLLYYWPVGSARPCAIHAGRSRIDLLQEAGTWHTFFDYDQCSAKNNNNDLNEQKVIKFYKDGKTCSPKHQLRKRGRCDGAALCPNASTMQAWKMRQSPKQKRT
jgi:hypothetical protein